MDSSTLIIEAGHADARTWEAMSSLLKQLSPDAPELTLQALEEIVDAPATRLLLAVHNTADRKIVGSLTLAIFSIPSGKRAWIEDVVVAPESRGQGTGSALVTAAIDMAQAAGAKTIDLTSRPSREAANRLYQKLGFAQRNTNVYRYTIPRS
ncbi:MAG: GNAT family N-acetyltransferase [Acidimicrobiales bacterium]